MCTVDITISNTSKNHKEYVEAYERYLEISDKKNAGQNLSQEELSIYADIINNIIYKKEE